MAGMDFFIRPATGTSSSDWLRIANADIKVRMTRRLTRTVIRGQEGDYLDALFSSRNDTAKIDSSEDDEIVDMHNDTEL